MQQRLEHWLQLYGSSWTVCARRADPKNELASCKTLASIGRGEREGYGEPYDVTSLSLSLSIGVRGTLRRN